MIPVKEGTTRVLGTSLGATCVPRSPAAFPVWFFFFPGNLLSRRWCQNRSGLAASAAAEATTPAEGCPQGDAPSQPAPPILWMNLGMGKSRAGATAAPLCGEAPGSVTFLVPEPQLPAGNVPGRALCPSAGSPRAGCPPCHCHSAVTPTTHPFSSCFPPFVPFSRRGLEAWNGVDGGGGGGGFSAGTSVLGCSCWEQNPRPQTSIRVQGHGCSCRTLWKQILLPGVLRDLPNLGAHQGVPLGANGAVSEVCSAAGSGVVAR